MPSLSVIMPVYNAEPYLGAALASVLGQSFSDFELVAVNDGSTDGSEQLLADRARDDPRVRVLHQPNAGVVAAVNVGLRHCRGEFVGRADADDVSLPDRFARQIEFLDRHRDVAVVGGSVQVIDGQGRASGAPVTYPCDPARVRERLWAGDCCLAQPSVMIRRSALEAVGYYRPALRQAEDYDLWLRMSDRFALSNLSEVLVQYRVHGESITSRLPQEQEICHRAALASARLRRDGQPDPIDSATELTPLILERLGIGPAEVEWVSAQAFRFRASNLLRSGEIDAANDVLEALSQQGFSTATLGRIEPEVRFVRARIDAARGRWLKATIGAAVTLARYPTFLAAVLRKVGRQILLRFGRRPAA